MADEIKPTGIEGNPPEGGELTTPPPANQGPSVEELQKQNKELQEKYAQEMKERDARIADLENTNATIAARQRQIDEAKAKEVTDTDLKERIRQINERRAYDPDGADAEMASLLSERDKKVAQDAVAQATAVISQQTIIDKLRMGVRSANPDLDDELVDDVMAKANMLATTGKYRTAEEAVTAATQYVKGKLESYAKKKNAMPPLPEGARAEAGGANQPPVPPTPPKEKSPLEELEEANEQRNRKFTNVRT